ncbi:hypothetical protein BDR06DRAFT_974517 [Suillus hirtellus]|nr:hypothetical protein BDR06DRAFT_974517 [Suillus hirtellus]
MHILKRFGIIRMQCRSLEPTSKMVERTYATCQFAYYIRLFGSKAFGKQQRRHVEVKGASERLPNKFVECAVCTVHHDTGAPQSGKSDIICIQVSFVLDVHVIAHITYVKLASFIRRTSFEFRMLSFIFGHLRSHDSHSKTRLGIADRIPRVSLTDPVDWPYLVHGRMPGNLKLAEMKL